MALAYDAVTFDFWNTLCVTDNERYRAERLEVTRALLAREGIDRHDEEIEEALRHLFEVFNQSWADQRQFTASDAVDVLVERLAPTLSDAARVELSELYAGANRASPAPLAPNVAETLARLSAAGLRLGIICDVGMSPSVVLRGFLDHHGVLGYFDHWSFSDEVGVYKPDRRIFEHALAGLGGVDPARAVHVGDLLRTDVAGAQDMGMVAVRYRAVHDDPGDVGDTGGLLEADHVLDDHADLPAILGIEE
jgi:putative hydrolase of the HAD superfamily